MFYTGILAIMSRFKIYFLSDRNCLSLRRSFCGFIPSLQQLLTQDYGLRFLLGFTPFANLSFFPIQVRTLALWRHYPAVTFWSVPRVWLPVCGDKKQFSFRISSSPLAMSFSRRSPEDFGTWKIFAGEDFQALVLAVRCHLHGKLLVIHRL